MADRTDQTQPDAEAARIALACGDPSFESEFLDSRQYDRNIAQSRAAAAQSARQHPWHEPFTPGTLDV